MPFNINIFKFFIRYLDSNEYESGIKVTDEELSNINIIRHAFHGNDWNYTIVPIN
ncbi:MAG: hypothetical protein KAS17_10940 [Victivallaceae bacterium]|nr:hypothetical protein [Victivallaceae bacterium]